MGETLALLSVISPQTASPRLQTVRLRRGVLGRDQTPHRRPQARQL